MPKQFLFLLSLFVFTHLGAQTKIQLHSPLNIPLYLSGNFGELRSNHFHSGIDIKTNGVEGLKVFAADDGFVFRIKISRGGYGKALYIKHPNGLVTVYGHLKNFNKQIESYIKQKQYEKKSYEIEVFPYKIELPVKRGEVVAYSGNTGGSSGAHLHFEVRNQKEHPLNPMAFGIHIDDHQYPILQNLYAYSLDQSSHINQVQNRVKLSFDKVNDSLYLANPILAFGKIGIGIQAFDRQDHAWNKNGIYKVQVQLNGLPVYEHIMQEFSFYNSHYINTLIDYKQFLTNWKRIQKLWIEPYNHLEIYTQLVDEGVLTIKSKQNYYIQLFLFDFEGNKTEIKIPVYGYKTKILQKEKKFTSPHLIKLKKDNTISFSNYNITFPPKTAYYNFYVKIKNYKNGLQLVTDGVPLHKSFQIKYPLDKLNKKRQKYAYWSQVNSKGNSYYINTKKKQKSLIGYTKSFGKYLINYDSIPPYIKPANFKPKGKLTNYHYLKIKIGDKETGIKNYNAYIDGKWVLFEYEYKTKMLTYNFNDRKLSGYKHTLKVVVTDKLGNKKVLETYFYRKD